MIDGKGKRHGLNEARLDAIPSLSQKIYYFQGCTERAYPGINAAFIETCRLLGNAPMTSNEQSCCTGNLLAFNAVPLETPLAISQRNYNVIKAKAPACVTTCNGCFSSFVTCDYYLKQSRWREYTKSVMKGLGKAFIDDVPVFHAAEFYYKNRAEIYQHARRSLDGLKMAIHYGCHFLHQDDPSMILDDFENPGFLEELVRGLGGEGVDYRERLACCGAGLNQRMLHDDRTNSLQITLRKMNSIKSCGAEAIVVVCPYCLLHLDNAQAELEVEFDEEFELPVLHISELVGILYDLPASTLRPDAHKVGLKGIMEKIGYSG
nr:heterodisulfide reductase-related iron-sulfur binding cluster [Candidatus Sigynarchaeum springense]